MASAAILAAALSVSACNPTKPAEPAENMVETVVPDESVVGDANSADANAMAAPAENSAGGAETANAAGTAAENATGGSEPVSAGSNGGSDVKPH